MKEGTSGMASKTIIFGGGAAGRFRTWRWPRRDGVYRYLPYRSVAHLRMYEQLRETGSARCHYERDGRQVCFSVVASPKYAHLQLAEFAIEMTRHD
jgi:hypothetical protein